MKNTDRSQDLITALTHPDFYPHKPLHVELTQTQMSFVFLTGEYAFKVKKTINLGYLDYTTLENRRYFCMQELELNRRLSPDVYLEVLPITETTDGKIALAGEGEIIEYALKMKQLPLERLMDRLLQKGEVTSTMIEKVAKKMALFHKNAATEPEISQFGKLTAIMININENETQTEKYIGTTVSAHEFNRIDQFNSDFMEKNLNLFYKRVREGKIRDCHGDLHAAHICFSNGIDIFDCIEFNDRFRYCDVASEIAFLAMDIERYGKSDLSQSFVNAYIGESGDRELLDLLFFYKCYRACVRGKVESFKLDDPLIQDKEKINKTAKNYFNLAYHYTMKRPFLIIISGLMGTGKTALAQALYDSTGFTVISSDITRKNLAGIPLTEHRFAEFNKDIYSTEFTGKTYIEMLKQANMLLSDRKSVILDASFGKRNERSLAYNLAREKNADFLIIECTLNEDKIKNRLEKRSEETSVSDGRWEIFETQRQNFDKMVEFSPEEHIVIDTSLPVNDIAGRVLERI